MRDIRSDTFDGLGEDPVGGEAPPAEAPPAAPPAAPPPGDVPSEPAPTPNAGGGVIDTPPAPPAPPVYPVPPVPPPPIQVGVAGGPAQTGSGPAGPSTFAGVGSEAAARYRTPFFATNRIQAAGSPQIPRFGPGAPTIGGQPAIDLGGGGEGRGGPNSDEELARIVQAVAAGRAPGR